MNPFAACCDEFSLFTYLNTRIDLVPTADTVLHWFETLRKTWPSLTDLDRRDTNEFSLEEDRERGHYRSIGIESRRVWSGYTNPPDPDDADEQHLKVLDSLNYHLDIPAINVDTLDVVFSFELNHHGNHDEVIADAMTGDSWFGGMRHLPGARVLNYEPSMLMALDEQCRLQARLHIETRTNAYQVRTSQYSDSPITVFFTIRQFWGKHPLKSYIDSYQHQRRIGQELLESHIIPNVLQPIALRISSS